jgi:hypothetical protein
MTILKAQISPLPKTLFDPMPEVKVTFEDGQSKTLFSYYPDEISFSPEEFVGLTEKEARALYTQKDIAYLQS